MAGNEQGGIPGLDARGREQLEEEIGRLSMSYTPQWRFNREEPDMGTALARLFAGMMEESIGQYNRLLEINRQGFMESIGAKPLPSGTAEGCMTFGLVKPDMPECLIPSGTRVTAATPSGSVGFETLEEVWVSAAKVMFTLVSERRGDELPPGVYLCFDRDVSQRVISLLFVVSGCGASGGGQTRWEYRGHENWLPLEAEDGTDGLSHGGILRFSGPPDLADRELLGRRGFWLRAVNGDGGSNISAVCINGAKVRALRPGTDGNLAPGGKHRLAKTVGFVSVVRNPDYFSGGSGEEEEEAFMARSGAGLRHRARAVTPGDFESLVRTSCRDAWRVKCYPGYDGTGKKRYGAVTVVILQREYQEGRRHFYKVREMAMACLRDKASRELVEGNLLTVTAPRLIRMDVRAVISVRGVRCVMEARGRAREMLEAFLNPITGGPDGTGWELGCMPEHRQIVNCLQNVPELLYVKQLSCLCYEEVEGRWQETEYGRICGFPWALPTAGDCRVEVLAEAGQAV